MALNNRWARGVSIIGCGMTRTGNAARDPWLKGMSERDLLAWAVLDACEDAGVQVKDLDASCLGQTNVILMRQLAMNQVLNHVIGAEGKPAFSVVMGCASAVASCDIIGAKIAAGQIDIGLVVAVAMTVSKAEEKEGEYLKHPGQRVMTDEWMKNVSNAMDQAYWDRMANALGGGFVAGLQSVRYMKRYGLSEKQIDDVLLTITKNMRDGAVNHPMSQYAGGETFEDLAKKEGRASALDYLRDPLVNPFIGWPVRAMSMPSLVDGASAMILCASDIADKVSKKKPIEIVGIGQGGGVAFSPASDMRYVQYAEDGAKRQCYAMANISDPESQLDYMVLHDPMGINHLTDAELTGYIRPGEAWKMVLQGETRFDGKRPMQTHGGETQFGDSTDPAAIIDIIEAVQQMRGECGARQMKTTPKCSVVVGRGLHQIGMMVLRDIN